MSQEYKSDTDQCQFWQMAIESWQSSGLSIRQFCKQEGLSEPSFYSWRKRLTSVDVPKANKSDICRSEPFIRVSLPKQDAARLEIVLSSGHTLQIPPGFDRQTLTDVLGALSETHRC